jgi:hypothetical protein
MKEKKEKNRFTAKVLWSFGAPLLLAGLIALAFPDCQAWVNVFVGIALMLLSGYYWKKD